MSWWRRFWQRITGRVHPSQVTPKILRAWALGGQESYSGKDVSPHTALEFNPVYAAVSIVSEGLACLPLILYRREGSGRERAKGHPLFSLLHDAPNPEITSMEFRETLQAHVLTWGNGFAEIEWNQKGFPSALWPLRPDRVEVRRVAGELRYRVSLSSGEQVILPQHRVFHVRGLGFNGVFGYSPIQMQRHSVGTGLAQEEYVGRFYANDARPGVVLEYPGQVSNEMRKEMTKSWQKAHGTLSRKHRVAILEEGMSLKTIGFPPEQAQLIAARKFSVADAARLYRLPLFKLAEMEGTSYNSQEQSATDFVQWTLSPWCVRWEGAVRRSLLLPEERGRYYVEHLLDAVVRGDIRTRTGAYTRALQWGWMNRDEVREREGLNPIPGGEGQRFYMPANMTIVGGEEPAPAGKSEPRAVVPGPPVSHWGRESRSSAAIRRHRLGLAMRAAWSDPGRRVIRRERADIMRIAERLIPRGELAPFRQELERFYAGHGEFVARAFDGPARALARAFQADAEQDVGADTDSKTVEVLVDSYLEKFADRWVRSSQGQLLEILAESQRSEDRALSDDELLGELEERFRDWEDTRADKSARRETNQLGNAVTLAVFLAGGILRATWTAVGPSCPICRSLDGKTVATGEPFAQSGFVFDLPGLSAPFTVPHTKRHPPAHRGCDCQLTAG